MWLLRLLLILGFCSLPLSSYGYEVYIVKKGDSLIKISHKLGIDYKVIKQLNPNINWTKIRPNDRIKVPVPNTKGSLSQSSDDNTYIVKPGDSLIKIAKKLNYTYKQLKEANPHINWLKIRPGQKIKLPSKHIVQRHRPQPGEIGNGYYVVKKGDTLRAIANRFGLSLEQLRKLNPNLTRLIRPGDIIVLPPDLTQKIIVARKAGVFLPAKYLPYTQVYQVQQGDSLWEIAQKFKVDVDLIKAINDLSSNILRVGQIIFVPDAKLKEAQRLKLKLSIIAEKRRELIRYAKRFIGVPYKFGGESLKSGIDCSAFVQKIYRKFHIYLPRTAEGQFKQAGVTIPINRLQPGDLLFFHTLDYAPVTHVAIYIGHGRFIHAAGRKHGVKISRFTKYYWRHFVAAKRILSLTTVQYAYNHK